MSQPGEGAMRALILALAAAAAPCVASAQAGNSSNNPGITGPEIRVRIETHTVPNGAPKQAEDAVRHELGDPDGAKFSQLRANEVASVRRSPFEDAVDGPVSVVCGEFAVPNHKSGWFFVALKQGRVLWTTLDKDPDSSLVAYYSCKGAGLTNDGAPQTLPDG
jgi:hypothetical protein